MTAVRFNVRSDVQVALKQFKDDQLLVRKAAARAINRTADRVKTQFDREIRETYTVKKAALGRRIVMRKRASIYALKAEIEASGNPIPITNFSFYRGKRGVSVKVRKGGPRTRIEKTFIISTGNGEIIVARGRYRGNTFVPNVKDSPTKLVGPGVPQMFNAADLQRRIQTFTDRVFAERLAHELGRLLGAR